MAKLNPYFGTHAGEMKIYVGVYQVGKGEFDQFGDFSATFDGSYQFLGQQGTLELQLTLSDQNPAAPAGPCAITLNGKNDTAAKYQVNGQKLTITTELNDTPIDVYGKEGGTQVDNISGHSIWIGQWG